MRFFLVLFMFSMMPSLSSEKTDESKDNAVEYSTPQPRTVYHVEFDENGTSPEEPPFEIIPTEYLCEFCVSVIEMLKSMQKSDSNFEETMRKDCLNSTEAGKKEICTYVNKVNLERLREGSPSEICLEEKLCLGQQKPKDTSSSTEIPSNSEKRTDKVTKTTRWPKIYNRFVTLNLLVDDIAK